MNTTAEDLPIESLDELNGRYADTFIPFAVCVGIMATVGIVGNVIVLYVFGSSQEYKNTNFKIFVIFLAFIDLLACFALMPAEIAKTRTFFSFPNAMPCKMKCFFNIFFSLAAAMGLLTICIDRFRKVCQPLKKQIYPGVAFKMVIVAMVFSFVVAIPAPIMCGISTANKTNIYNTTTTVYLCTAEKRFQKSILRTIYKLTLSLLLFGVSITLSVMYVCIGRVVVRQWNAKEKKLGSFSSGSETSDTRTHIDRLTDTNADTITDTQSINMANHTSAHTKRQTPKVALSRKESTVSTSSDACAVKYSVSDRRGSQSAFRLRLRRRQSSISVNGVPYKTLIWLILTAIFIITNFFTAILSFMTPSQYRMSPNELLGYTFMFRCYFVNNIINPIIYAWLDRRFKSSVKRIISMNLCRR